MPKLSFMEVMAMREPHELDDLDDLEPTGEDRTEPPKEPEGGFRYWLDLGQGDA